MRHHSTSRGCYSFTRAGQLAATVTLAILLAGGCGSVNSAGGDAAAGTSGQGGRAGSGAGGSTGSAGTTGTAGSGIGGTTGPGGSSGGSNGGAAGAGRGGGGGGGTAGSSGGGSTGSGGGAGGTTSPCQAVIALDRSCTTAGDCFAGTHTSNCCGQKQFIGIRNSVKTEFQTLEAQCDATYPACGCAEGQPTADDGSRLRFGVQASQAGLTCLQGKCTTFVLDCGQPCGTGTTCFSCSNHNQSFAACTTMCTDSNACVDTALPLCQMGTSGNTSGKFCTASNVACDTK